MSPPSNKKTNGKKNLAMILGFGGGLVLIFIITFIILWQTGFFNTKTPPPPPTTPPPVGNNSSNTPPAGSTPTIRPVGTPPTNNSNSGSTTNPTTLVRNFPIPNPKSYEFGGMYGYGEKNYGNPLAKGLQGCPSASFEKYRISGVSNKDNDLFYCAKKINDHPNWKPSKGSAEFGGMYTGNGVYKNPLAKDPAVCPEGFDSHQALGTHGTDHGLHYCIKKIEDPDNWIPDESTNVEFGGMFSSESNPVDGKNPATDAKTCPDGGFIKSTLYDSNATKSHAADYEINYCVLPR